ncbi:MAG: glutathione synthase [Dyadobacter sp. 50-39]|uniref:glutathione synthase n=1 Tax=Dyadobacter sp. 50-39 TaxID=1895756 RepID=UPI0009645A8D|nr:glutathione synthase [Dyadobacter sp. 50-39]OJV12991.1 MAG: glutathione synthase [Dyadobacter sp. 50-39]
MKKIGILFGMENTFPNAFIERINSKGEDGIVAEAVTIDKVIQAAPTEYAVIIDRISQDVPFYRAYLKNAALTGTAVINNPFWWSADEKFFNNALAEKLGIPVPKTVLLPSKQRPTNTTETSFRNLAFPMAWEEIFQYVGFPAYMKPHDGGGWKSVYRVVNPQDMWIKHEETGQLVMMLQEEIVFDDYVRCYCIGQKDVLVMPYEPRNPHHLRYAADLKAQGEEREKLLETIKEYTLKLNIALGYDFNTVEFAVRDGIPYAIDFCNPAPDADIYSVGPDNFEWVVEAAANMAIERAKAQVPGQINLTWGTFVNQALNGIPAPVPEPATGASPSAKEVKVKTQAPKKPAKSLGAIVTEPIAVAEPAEPKIPTTKVAATKAPAKNSRLKKS